MALDIALTTIENIIFNTSFAGQFWIAQLAIIISTLALITRKTSDWMTLTLPILVGWQTYGLYFSWIFYAVAGAMFVINVLSIETINNAIEIVSQNFGYIRDRNGLKGTRKYNKLQTIKRRMDIKKEMDNITISSDPKNKESVYTQYAKDKQGIESLGFIDPSFRTSSRYQNIPLEQFIEKKEKKEKKERIKDKMRNFY